MTMPNFLIIGAQKAGTTSLYHYLGQHPQVYVSPIKEPNFFASEGEMPDPRRPSINDIEAYENLFDGVSDEKAIGEASPWYLYSPKAPERIKHYIPDAKLIAILRDPAERAYSQFLHFVRDRREPTTDFLRALREEEARVRDNLAAGRDNERAASGAYFARGLYFAQLERYLEFFDRSQIKVVLSEDLDEDPVATLREVFQFLEVDDAFVPSVATRHQVAGLPKNRLLHAFLTKPNLLRRVFRMIKLYLPPALRLRIANNLVQLKNQNFVEPPGLPPEARRHLVEAYREDVLKLQELIHRDLSSWLR